MTDQDTLRADLAFLKELADTGGRVQWPAGATFLAGGLLYGLQCLVQSAHQAGWITLPPFAYFGFIVGVTIAFLAILTIIIVQGHKLRPAGVANRAVQAVLSSIGLGNLALLALFASAAVPRQSVEIWQLYPAALFALLGAAWHVMFVMRRRLWLAAVSMGWFLSAVMLAILVGRVSYGLVAGICLIVLMALPGAYMMHLAKKT